MKDVTVRAMQCMAIVVTACVCTFCASQVSYDMQTAHAMALYDEARMNEWSRHAMEGCGSDMYVFDLDVPGWTVQCEHRNMGMMCELQYTLMRDGAIHSQDGIKVVGLCAE